MVKCLDLVHPCYISTVPCLEQGRHPHPLWWRELWSEVRISCPPMLHKYCTLTGARKASTSSMLESVVVRGPDFLPTHATMVSAVRPPIVYNNTEPVLVDLLRSPGIDFQPGGPVRQPYLSYRLARLHRLAESILRNRFLGSINVYKYGLCSKRIITGCRVRNLFSSEGWLTIVHSLCTPTPTSYSPEVSVIWPTHTQLFNDDFKVCRRLLALAFPYERCSL
jgi:hypothetical protein